ncbi:class I SAM-dependent methyltransferase [Xanthomonas fragariae]|uniref:class I SAM-dependent methyltransferase n=1 Tax=Xanthomonas fragariae TaxID=48664 RepID=UPI001ABED972|nr:class I SAM-dependent methyltransferase [Xanthomonas fragariae]UKR53029.1 class I SAM-dependent methyltransferase [Xanthomonas fragariae]
MIDFSLSPSMLIAPRSVPFSAWLGHVPFASWLVEQLRPRSIVELGTHSGASFLAFCQAVEEQELTSRVFAVDSWEGDEHAGFYGDDIYNELRGYQQRNYPGISEMLRMRFNEALEYFADDSIDLLHIDGLHTYEAVREDFETWLPKLTSCGVVLFHDTCVRERGFGVWQYWAEISQQYPAFEFTHTYGLGVLLVGEQRNPALLELADTASAGAFAPINRLFDVLGRNVKNIEELERVYAGLADARGQVMHLTQQGQMQQQHVQHLEQQAQQLQQQFQQLEQQAQQHLHDLERQSQQHALHVQQLEQQVQQLSQDSAASAELQRAVAEERAQALNAIKALVVPRLESSEQKLDKVLLQQRWWRR